MISSPHVCTAPSTASPRLISNKAHYINNYVVPTSTPPTYMWSYEQPYINNVSPTHTALSAALSLMMLPKVLCMYDYTVVPEAVSIEEVFSG